MRKLNTFIVLTCLVFSGIAIAEETVEPTKQQEASSDNSANQTSQQLTLVDLTTVENPAVKLCQIRGSKY